MSATSFIDYRFAEGRVQNADGGIPGTVVNCVHKPVMITLGGWGQLKNALEFKKAGSIVKIPAVDRLLALETFAVEMAILPKPQNAAQMTLLEGRAAPMSLYLKKSGAGFLLGGAIQVRGIWQEVLAENQTITPDQWTAVSMVFTGDDLVLFINNHLAARRVLQAAELIPGSLQDYVIGAKADGRQQFVGEIAGVRMWDEIPENLMAAIVAAEKSGAGEIDSKYQELGGAAGFLKLPTAPEKKIGQGLVRTYQGGNIYWSADTGAFEVHGEILKKYLQAGGPLNFMGFPLADEAAGKKPGSRISRFEGGAVYWSQATKACEVHGMIFARYLDLGAEKGILGLPVSDEAAAPGGRKSQFEKGVIYWSSITGAFEVHGMIHDRYVALGGPGGFLGYPISDENVVYGKDKKPTAGRWSRFSGGTIYWSPQTGAWEVHGAIREHYESLGGPMSALGYPGTNESAVAGTAIRYNDFQNGIIVWQPGMGARAVTALQISLGWVKTSKIDDGIDWFKKDKTAEVLTYTTLTINGTAVQNNVRRPSGKGTSSSYHINYKYTIPKVQHNTSIYLKIKVDDWDAASANDYLGTHEKTFDIRSLWGLLGGSPAGIYYAQPATHKGGDAPSLDTIKFDYSIQPPSVIDPAKHFREQYWWAFDNFSTPSLSRQQFVETFRDVEVAENAWDKFMSLFDTIYYNAAYEGIASKGNCFGMSLESIYCRTEQSIFVEPLFQYKAAGNKCWVEEADVPAAMRGLINLRHGYQLGASAIRWIIARLASLDAVRPLNVYDRVKYYLAQGNFPVLSMINLDGFSGHAVTPYRCQDGSGSAPHRIYVADPNVPWCAGQNDPTYIEVCKNNTFRFIGGTLNYQSSTIVAGLLPGTLMFEMPFHRLSSQPRTPFWEILLAIAALVGGILLIAGDAESTQVSGDGRNFYQPAGNKKQVIPNGIPGMARIPFLDYQGRVPELYAQSGRLPNELKLEVKGVKNGSFRQYFRTRTNAVAVDSPITLNAQDAIRMNDVHSSRPMLELSSSQAVKTAKIDYGVILDSRGRDLRRVQVDLQVAKNEVARLGAAPRGGSFVMAPAGPKKPLVVTLESRAGNAVKKTVLRHTPAVAGEVLRIRPTDWNSGLKDVVVERLSSVTGGVLKREIKRTQP